MIDQSNKVQIDLFGINRMILLNSFCFTPNNFDVIKIIFAKEHSNQVKPKIRQKSDKNGLNGPKVTNFQFNEPKKWRIWQVMFSNPYELTKRKKVRQIKVG